MLQLLKIVYVADQQQMCHCLNGPVRSVNLLINTYRKLQVGLASSAQHRVQPATQKAVSHVIMGNTSMELHAASAIIVAQHALIKQITV